MDYATLSGTDGDVGCLLHAALGRREDCPGEACALWEQGCTIEQLKLDLSDRADLASYLLELREQLEELRGG